MGKGSHGNAPCARFFQDPRALSHRGPGGDNIIHEQKALRDLACYAEGAPNVLNPLLSRDIGLGQGLFYFDQEVWQQGNGEFL